MQRPTRILVFGILCLVFSAGAGIKNLTEFSLSLIGPKGFAAMVDMQPEGQLSETNKQAMDAQVAALRKPVYRIGLGVESFLSMVMAGVLLASGIGLLGDKRWGLAGARLWAAFALFGSVATAVLHARYVIPEAEPGAPGAAVAAGVFLLLVLWTLPVLILTYLSRPFVSAYLDQQSEVGAHARQPIDPLQRAEPRQGASSQPPSSSGVSTTRSSTDTWRDDPWNAP